MKQATKNGTRRSSNCSSQRRCSRSNDLFYVETRAKTKSVAFNDVFQQNPNTRLAALDATQMQPVDLTQAAENSVHAVVHIKSTQESKTQTVTVRDPFYDFFGDIFGNGRGGGQQRQVQTPERVGFGSGVIISKDGYIVTNNHVIDNADVISVKLNDGREYKGRVIGTDPSTDLALVKIEADELLRFPWAIRRL